MSSWASLLRYALLAAIFGLVGMGIFAKRGWLDWRRIVQQNAEMVTKLDDAMAQKILLESQIAALQSDTEQQEALVRQTLGYVRSPETVIEFQ